MKAQKGIIPVIAAPLMDPASGRIDMSMPVGATVEQIVQAALPDLKLRDRAHCRVMLVSDRGSMLIAAEWWSKVRPHEGVRVVIRIVPGKDALKSVLSIVVSIVAIALGQFWAPAVAGALGISTQAAAAIIGLGVTVIGNLLINALIPPTKPLEQENRYQISGMRNRMDPDGAVPLVLGTIRYAPPFACYSYTEIVGDWQYIRAAMVLGYGPVSISDIWIGDTKVSEYDEVQIETREGRAGDAPLTLITRQVIEEQIGAELLKPLPRDDLGEVISGGAAEEDPVIRTTGGDASGASVILAWPGGLVRYNKEGKALAHTVTVRIRQRRVQDEDWTNVTTLTVKARKLEAFYRQHTWDFPERGRWQVECTMMTAESTSSQVQQRTSWAVLQTIRPEYPLNFPHPLALMAVRIKATHQLNGQLDNISGVVSNACLDYDHTTGTWIERETSNPASHFRNVLQSVANPKRTSDAGIDLALLAQWHDFCRIKGLKYDRVIDDKATQLRDLLTEIAAAGRASPRHDGIKWGVTVDRPDKLIIDHFSPRNTYSFSATRSYVEPPDGFRITFADAANDYKQAERIVPWPGKEDAELLLTEELQLPGKTDAAEIYREARRRAYEAIHRPDIYNASRDGGVQVATRGDRVRLSSDAIDSIQVASRVKSVDARMIELDDVVTMEDGVDYAIRFRTGLTEEDTIGTSIIRTIMRRPGSWSVIAVNGDGPMPVAGDLVHFGTAIQLDYDVLVTGVEAGDDMSSHYRLIDLAPIIDETLDAEDIPAWSGRAGAELPGSSVAPAAPRFSSIQSGTSGTGLADTIDFLLEPGSGVAAAARYEVDHRVHGTSSWTVMDIAAAEGGGQISAYDNGVTVDLRVRAFSAAGTPSGYSDIVTFTVGAEDAGIPEALPSGMITVGALLGGAVVQFSTGDDAAITDVQLYLSTSSTLDREHDAYGDPVAVAASRSYSVPIGDSTRENLLTETGWTLGANWTTSGGVANHTAGVADAITHPVTLSAGTYYRISYRVTGRSAGTVTPRLTGGTTVSGTAATVNGTYSDRLQAAAGNAAGEWLASSTFNGAVDQLVLFQETSTCLSAGTHYVWLEPINADGVAGPVSGPFAVSIK